MNDVPDMAFPYELDLGDGSVAYYRGMSLRDYFAGQVIVALAMDVQPERIVNETGETEADVIADRAYLIAEAMMQRRRDESSHYSPREPKA